LCAKDINAFVCEKQSNSQAQEKTSGDRFTNASGTGSCTRCLLHGLDFLVSAWNANVVVFSGQHRSYAYTQIMAEDQDAFERNITSSFNVGVFDCMPKEISFFMSKVSIAHR